MFFEKTHCAFNPMGPFEKYGYTLYEFNSANPDYATILGATYELAKKVFVSRYAHREKQRYIIAILLGYHVLYNKKVVIYKTFSKITEELLNVKLFAREILLPAKKIKEIKSASAIADIYDCDINVVIERLKEIE